MNNARKMSKRQSTKKGAARPSAPLDPYSGPHIPLAIYMEPELDAEEVVVPAEDAERLIETMNPEYLPDEIFEPETPQPEEPPPEPPEAGVIEEEKEEEEEEAEPEPEHPPSIKEEEPQAESLTPEIPAAEQLETVAQEPELPPAPSEADDGHNYGSLFDYVTTRNSLLDFMVERGSLCEQIGCASEPGGCDGSEEESAPANPDEEEADPYYVGRALQSLTGLATLLVSVDDLGPYVPFQDMRPYFTLRGIKSEGQGVNVKLKEMNAHKVFDIEPPAPRPRSAPKITWNNIVEAIGYPEMDMNQKVDPMVVQVLERAHEPQISILKAPSTSRSAQRESEKSTRASEDQARHSNTSQPVQFNEPVLREPSEETVKAAVAAVTLPETNEPSLTSIPGGSGSTVKLSSGQTFMGKPDAFEEPEEGSAPATSVPESNLHSNYLLDAETDSDESIPSHAWKDSQFGRPPALSIVGMDQIDTNIAALNQQQTNEADAEPETAEGAPKPDPEAPAKPASGEIDWISYYQAPPNTSDEPAPADGPNNREKLADYFEHLNVDEAKEGEQEGEPEEIEPALAPAPQIPAPEQPVRPTTVEIGKPLAEHSSISFAKKFSKASIPDHDQRTEEEASVRHAAVDNDVIRPSVDTAVFDALPASNEPKEEIDAQPHPETTVLFDHEGARKSAGRRSSEVGSVSSNKSGRLVTEAGVESTTPKASRIPIPVQSSSRPRASEYIITYQSEEIPLSTWLKSNKDHVKTVNEEYEDAEHTFKCSITEITDEKGGHEPIILLDVNGKSVAISKEEADALVRPWLEQINGTDKDVVEEVKANLEQFAQRTGTTSDGKVKKRDFTKFPKGTSIDGDHDHPEASTSRKSGTSKSKSGSSTPKSKQSRSRPSNL